MTVVIGILLILLMAEANAAPGDVAAITTGFQQNRWPNYDYAGCTDAFLSSKYFDDNTGSLPVLKESSSTRNIRTILIKFDLKGNIHSDSTITSATLYLYYYGPASNNNKRIYAARVTSDWDQGTVTYNTPLSVEDPPLSWADWDLNETGWKEIDVTGLVEYWYANPDVNFGMKLTSDSTDAALFYSSEYTDSPGLRPKLTVTYRPPAFTISFPVEPTRFFSSDWMMSWHYRENDSDMNDGWAQMDTTLRKAGNCWTQPYIPWVNIEDEPFTDTDTGKIVHNYNTYNLNQLDRQIAYLKGLDYRVALVIDPSMSVKWNWYTWGDMVDKNEDGEVDNLIGGNLEAQRAFYETMTELATRFRGVVDVWQIDQEPSDASAGGYDSPEAYARLLRAGYHGVKKGDPDAFVMFSDDVYHGWTGQVLAYLAENYPDKALFPFTDSLAPHLFRTRGPDHDTGYSYTSAFTGTMVDALTLYHLIGRDYGISWDNTTPIGMVQTPYSTYGISTRNINNDVVTFEQQANYRVRKAILELTLGYVWAGWSEHMADRTKVPVLGLWLFDEGEEEQTTAEATGAQDPDNPDIGYDLLLGDTANDEIFDPVWLMPGKYGSALKFDRDDNDRVTRSYPWIGPNPTGNKLTVEAWINPGSEIDIFSASTIVSAGRGGENGYTLDTNYRKLRFHVGDKVFAMTDPLINTFDVWHHVAAVWNGDADMVTLYLNGKETDTFTNADVTYTNGDTRFRIGTRRNMRGFPGAIDEVRISDAALRPGQLGYQGGLAWRAYWGSAGIIMNKEDTSGLGLIDSTGDSMEDIEPDIPYPEQEKKAWWALNALGGNYTADGIKTAGILKGATFLSRLQLDKETRHGYRFLKPDNSMVTVIWDADPDLEPSGTTQVYLTSAGIVDVISRDGDYLFEKSGNFFLYIGPAPIYLIGAAITEPDRATIRKISNDGLPALQGYSDAYVIDIQSENEATGIEVTVPDGWTLPQDTDSTRAGYITVEPGPGVPFPIVSISGAMIGISFDLLAPMPAGGTLRIYYGDVREQAMLLDPGLNGVLDYSTPKFLAPPDNAYRKPAWNSLYNDFLGYGFDSVGTGAWYANQGRRDSIYADGVYLEDSDNVTPWILKADAENPSLTYQVKVYLASTNPEAHYLRHQVVTLNGQSPDYEDRYSLDRGALLIFSGVAPQGNLIQVSVSPVQKPSTGKQISSFYGVDIWPSGVGVIPGTTVGKNEFTVKIEGNRVSPAPSITVESIVPIAMWQFDEGTGQRASEATGAQDPNNPDLGYDLILGTSTNMENQDPVWVPGKYGNALKFNKSENDRVYRQETDTDKSAWGPYPITNNLTVEAWVKLTDSVNYTGVIVFNGYSGSAGYTLYLKQGRPCLHLMGVTYADAGDDTVPNDGNWHHIAGVWDGDAGTVKLYLNGSVIEEFTGAPGSYEVGFADFLIGTCPAGHGFPGAIDEV
ncbi:MAG: LamG-like jellyroll fold domain-containing protein, partial [Nitrospinota bacterium]